MEQESTPSVVKPTRAPWNKGKFVAAKPQLRPSHVWSIRTKLQIEGKKRDLALFNLAIDSKLRGCDVVAVRVDDVARADPRWTARRSGKGRPAGLCGSRLRTKRGKHSMSTCASPDASQASFYSPAAATKVGRRPGSTLGWCKSGWPASALTLQSSARIRCGGRRPC